MPIKAGRLRHRVTIRQPYSNAANPDRDVNGQPIADWKTSVGPGAPDGKVWAEIKPLSQRELFAADVAQINVTHKITIRYWPGISALFRFEYQDPGLPSDAPPRVFFIDGTPTSPDEYRELLECMCQERGA